jgi:hypothetical protein
MNEPLLGMFLCILSKDPKRLVFRPCLQEQCASVQMGLNRGSLVEPRLAALEALLSGRSVR